MRLGANDRQEGSVRPRKDFKTRLLRRDKWSQLPSGFPTETAAHDGERSRMSQQDRQHRVEDGTSFWAGPSEPQSYTEHQAALDATLFRLASDPYELVLELDSGELRLHGSSED